MSSAGLVLCARPGFTAACGTTAALALAFTLLALMRTVGTTHTLLVRRAAGAILTEVLTLTFHALPGFGLPFLPGAFLARSFPALIRKAFGFRTAAAMIFVSREIGLRDAAAFKLVFTTRLALAFQSLFLHPLAGTMISTAHILLCSLMSLIA